MKHRTCKLCGLSFTDTEKAVWCKLRNCPETKQREPTETQRKEYQMDRPFDAKERDHDHTR